MKSIPLLINGILILKVVADFDIDTKVIEKQ